MTAIILMGGAAVYLVFRTRIDRVAFTAGIAALLVGGEAGNRTRQDSVLIRARSFFGVYVVRQSGSYHHLTSGTTLHGAQDMSPANRTRPLTYYHRAGPLGRIFAHGPASAARRVAAVGLGAGTAACHGAPGDRWTFYEIDPLVARIASDERWFTYLHDCPPESDIVLGDARLRIAEALPGEFDMIMLDAFSSDAIPLHLLTKEALALYLEKLAPHGVIAVHISNRYLDLRSPLAALARDARLAGLVGRDISPEREEHPLDSWSTWVVLSRHASDFAALSRSPGWEPLPSGGETASWTDDWSHVLGAIRRR